MLVLVFSVDEIDTFFDTTIICTFVCFFAFFRFSKEENANDFESHHQSTVSLVHRCKVNTHNSWHQYYLKKYPHKEDESGFTECHELNVMFLYTALHCTERSVIS